MVASAETPAPPASVSRVRVEIFVDGSNLHPALEESGIMHPVAFGALGTAIVAAVGGTELVRLNYVAGAYPEPNKRDPRLQSGEYTDRLARKRSTDQLYARVAKEPGVVVWRERFKYRTPNARDSRPVVEKGTDIRVALLMYEGARDDRYDIAVLAASDTDFCPAVEMVCALGKPVIWAYAPIHGTMKDLVGRGAQRLELSATFLAPCRYVPANPTGPVTGIASRV